MTARSQQFPVKLDIPINDIVPFFAGELVQFVGEDEKQVSWMHGIGSAIQIDPQSTAKGI